MKRVWKNQWHQAGVGGKGKELPSLSARPIQGNSSTSKKDQASKSTFPWFEAWLAAN